MKTSHESGKGGQVVIADATFQAPLATATESANGQLWMAQVQYTVTPIPPFPGAAIW